MLWILPLTKEHLSNKDRIIWHKVCPITGTLLIYNRTCLERQDHPIDHKDVVCQRQIASGDRFSFILKCRSFCKKCVVCQDRWSLMAMVSEHSFHCIIKLSWKTTHPFCHIKTSSLQFCIPASSISQESWQYGSPLLIRTESPSVKWFLY